LLFLAGGFLFIAMGSKHIPASGASIIFLTGLYFIHTIGELCLSPIGLSMVNKLTPMRFTSLMMGVYFLAIATGNKLAGSLSALYPEEQNVSRSFNASNVLLDGKMVDWETVTNSRDANPNYYFSIELVKSKSEVKEADSLVSITTNKVSSPLVFDTKKIKRIIPHKYDEAELKKIAKWGDKEPKFIFGFSKESKICYVLRNEQFAKNNKITLEEWNTNPKKPSFMGIEIKDLYTYFMLFVALSGIASFILFLLSKKLEKMMHGVK
jgi:POT family proton-dependent oligopeptide transporter